MITFVQKKLEDFMRSFIMLLTAIGIVGAIISFILAFKFGFFSHSKKAVKICIVIGIICTILFFIGATLSPDQFASNKKISETCSTCHKTYSYESHEYGGYDYNNVKSIRSRNMCERCYSNYKYAQYAKDYID